MTPSVLFNHLSFALLTRRVVVLFPLAVVLTSVLAPSAGFMGDELTYVAFGVVDH